MKYNILHQSRGFIRLHIVKGRMSLDEAGRLEAWLGALPGVQRAQVYEQTCDAVIFYRHRRREILEKLSASAMSGIWRSPAVEAGPSPGPIRKSWSKWWCFGPCASSSSPTPSARTGLSCD